MKKYLVIVFVALLSFTCKKEKEYFVNEQELYGFWDVEMLSISDVDTTAYLRSDSTCFPMFIFNRPDDTYRKFETAPAFNYPDSTFECYKTGLYTLSGNAIFISLSPSGHNTGPFLIDGATSWEIVNYSGGVLNLKTIYSNQTCLLNLRKR